MIDKMKEIIESYYPSPDYSVSVSRWTFPENDKDTRYNIVITVANSDDYVIKLWNTHSIVSYEEAERYLLEQLYEGS